MINHRLETAIRNQVDVDEDLYNNRHGFKLDSDEVIHLARRISVTPDTGSEDDWDENDVNFYYHVWFDKNGWVWYLISETEYFPDFGKDVPYQAPEDHYSDLCGRGSRRYIFGDMISPAVIEMARKRLAEVPGLKKSECGDGKLRSFFFWDKGTFKREKVSDEIRNGSY